MDIPKNLQSCYFTHKETQNHRVRKLWCSSWTYRDRTRIIYDLSHVQVQLKGCPVAARTHYHRSKGNPSREMWSGIEPEKVCLGRVR